VETDYYQLTELWVICQSSCQEWGSNLCSAG